MSDKETETEIVRILRIIEYTGPRDLVEKQVSMSIHGTAFGLQGKVRITAATLGEFPEIISRDTLLYDRKETDLSFGEREDADLIKSKKENKEHGRKDIYNPITPYFSGPGLEYCPNSAECQRCLKFAAATCPGKGTDTDTDTDTTS